MISVAHLCVDLTPRLFPDQAPAPSTGHVTLLPPASPLRGGEWASPSTSTPAGAKLGPAHSAKVTFSLYLAPSGPHIPPGYLSGPSPLHSHASAQPSSLLTSWLCVYSAVSAVWHACSPHHGISKVQVANLLSWAPG